MRSLPTLALLSFGLALECVAVVAGAASRGLQPTLQTHTGPWYAPGAPETGSIWQPGDPGKPLYLEGMVLSTRGTPVEAALVEIWHTDSEGSYPPLRAAIRTRANGRFAVRTVLPGHHLGYRARHIHFVVTHPDHQPLVTRIYFMGDRNIEEAPYPELAIVLEEASIDGETRLLGNVEFVLLPY